MLSCTRLFLIALIIGLVMASSLAQEKTSPSPTQSPTPQAAPNVDEWGDNFDGKELDQTKWERFSFEGGSGGKFKVEEGQLRMRGVSGSRSGVRSTRTFTGDRFVINAVLAKVGAALPEPNQPNAPPGNAILTLLFDSSGRNRIEWILTSEGTFEAWAIVDGRSERLDNRNLGTRATNPTLSIARRGDEYLFALNGQVGLQKTIKNLPRGLRVMLYGYGSSENNWDSLQVLMPKKP